MRRMNAFCATSGSGWLRPSQIRSRISKIDWEHPLRTT
jgi:hypothetical protein